MFAECCSKSKAQNHCDFVPLIYFFDCPIREYTGFSGRGAGMGVL